LDELLECAFGVVWEDLDEQNLMEFIYLTRFGFKMWEILIFVK
jgi:hypothetical protein